MSAFFLGNCLFSIVLIHAIRKVKRAGEWDTNLQPYLFQETRRLLSAWNCWTCISFLILASLIIVKTVTKGFTLELAILCLSSLIVNIYLGLLVFSLR